MDNVCIPIAITIIILQTQWSVVTVDTLLLKELQSIAEECIQEFSIIIIHYETHIHGATNILTNTIVYILYIHNVCTVYKDCLLTTSL